MVLAHLLHQQGIDTLVLERHSREYVERRLRAGVLEQTTADLLIEAGLGDRMQREGLIHHGVSFQFEGERHRIALSELTGGRAITVYGQHEVVKDLIATRLAAGGEIVFDAQDLSLHGIDGEHPRVRYTVGEETLEATCEFVAGCDGFHGVCRPSIPVGALRLYEKSYPFAWLGILAASPPATHEIIYAHHDRGFALNSMRSPQLSRLYVQCDPHDSIDEWPDERIWSELRVRLSTNDGWTPAEGPIVEKGITTMRSFVAEPMQWGRLYLAGDAAHVVPPTGAKGMNLAVADARALADALSTWYRTGNDQRLRGYSALCLRRVWRAEHFSWWMTSMLHRMSDDPFETNLQRSQLRYTVSSRAQATALAENYVEIGRASCRERV